MYTRNNRAVIIDREEKKKKVFPFSFLFFLCWACAGNDGGGERYNATKDVGGFYDARSLLLLPAAKY